jgi:anti-anti-sigma factor
MVYEVATIPLLESIETAPIRLEHATDLEEAAGPLGTSLESVKLGLLATPGRLPDQQLKMEAWIAGNLDLELESMPQSGSPWHKILGQIPGLKRVKPARRVDGSAPEPSIDGWARFQVAYRRGITLVRLIDQSLVREAQIQELESELLDLIEAGNGRLILNFQGVHRLASMVIVVVDRAFQACAAQDGGSLKLCGLTPDLAEIFSIAGIAPGLSIYGDEASAIVSPWPAAAGPRPLPVEILSALTVAADIPPIQGGSPASSAARFSLPGESHAEGGGSPAIPLDSSSETTAKIALPQTIPAAERPRRTPDHLLTIDSLDEPYTPIEKTVWLEVQIGAAKARPVLVDQPEYTIGRDPGCQLRLGSPLVSKRHAAIIRRDGRIFVRDLGSTNGTVVNGRPLRSADEELQHDDRIQVGPIVATVIIGDLDRPESSHEVPSRIEPAMRSANGEAPRLEPHLHEDTGEFATSLDLEPEQKIVHELIQNVLVITPHLSDLEADDAIEMLRTYLYVMFERPMPHQVVINLEYVGHLSAKAIGVLLAHHLRLDRAGGALRICQARARVMAVLHQVRLTMLVECHPTMDQAVLGVWPRNPHSRGADL